jgi:hypothetical protein
MLTACQWSDTSYATTVRRTLEAMPTLRQGQEGTLREDLEPLGNASPRNDDRSGNVRRETCAAFVQAHEEVVLAMHKHMTAHLVPTLTSGVIR